MSVKITDDMVRDGQIVCFRICSVQCVGQSVFSYDLLGYL